MTYQLALARARSILLLKLWMLWLWFDAITLQTPQSIITGRVSNAIFHILLNAGVQKGVFTVKYEARKRSLLFYTHEKWRSYSKRLMYSRILPEYKLYIVPLFNYDPQLTFACHSLVIHPNDHLSMHILYWIRRLGITLLRTWRSCVLVAGALSWNPRDGSVLSWISCIDGTIASITRSRPNFSRASRATAALKVLVFPVAHLGSVKVYSIKAWLVTNLYK